MPLAKRLAAEGFGTFWLVFGGCGSAVLAAAYPNLGIGFAGVALAFGLTLLTMVYAIGPISGCHINPAVTIGLWAARRFPAREIVPYWIAQIIGGLVAGIAIGLALTLIHLISIPVDNTSVNPARSTGVAIFAGGDFISQLWLFWLAPLIGAVVAGFAYSALFAERPEKQLERERLSRGG
ncbi:MAG: aquaporin [Candidatus Lustribacter sp.]|jgi:glycerol uptake facilitator-like aquaporin